MTSVLLAISPYDNEVSVIELNAFALGVSWTSPVPKLHILKKNHVKNAIIMDNRSTTYISLVYIDSKNRRTGCLAALFITGHLLWYTCSGIF